MGAPRRARRGAVGAALPGGLAALSRLDRRAFTMALGSVCEHSPWVAARAWEARPFATVARLHAAMRDVLRTASKEEQLTVLRAHPPLAGRAVRPRGLTAFSAAEQSGAGLERLTAREAARFDRLNAAYRARFGFSFIICVRNHTRDGILDALAQRLGNPVASEVSTALREVSEIMRHRLHRLTGTSSSSARARRPEQ
jgi:2-oxo-4-hydroxy-4-carboxy-5-ureidoimidazoline decarboxylase